MSEGVQSSQQPSKKSVPPYSPRIPSAGAFTTQDKTGKHIQYVYCKEFHFSASCDRVTNPNGYIEERQSVFYMLGDWSSQYKMRVEKEL